MQDDTNQKAPDVNENQPTVDTVKQPTNNKRLWAVIGTVLGLLLITLIVLVFMLITKNDDAKTTDNSESEQSAQQDDSDSDQAVTQAGHEVLLRKATDNDKLELIIYKPKQNAANTTLYFGIENVCEGCEDSSSVAPAVTNFNNKNLSYLIDDNNGKKYSMITDEDGRALASASCSGMLAYGEIKECFASFSKVPSGSTVSWVYGDNRVDGIKVE